MIECPLDTNLVGIRLHRPWCAALVTLLALLASRLLTIKPRMYFDRPLSIPGLPASTGIDASSDFGNRIVTVVLCIPTLRSSITLPVLNVCSIDDHTVTRPARGVKSFTFNPATPTHPTESTA